MDGNFKLEKMVNIVNRTSGNAGLSTTVVSFFPFYFFLVYNSISFLFFDRPGTTLALLGAAAAAAGMLYTAVHERQQQTFLPSRAE